MERNKLIMMIGLPASGKSLIADQLSLEVSAVIHSSDNLRQELFGDVNLQDKNGELFTELHNRIKKDLKEGKNVIYDATNLNYKKRKGFLEELKKIDVHKQCIFVSTPYEKCLEQNNLRERKVPEYVIKRMYMSVNIPQYYEGWDSIQIIWSTEGYNFDTNLLFNGENGLNKIDQENPHHTFTIGKHCLMCSHICEELIDDFELNMAAMYHDIGKRFTKEYCDKRSEKEIWKDIDGYENSYEVSSFGNIRNKIRGNILKARPHSGGYTQVGLSGKNYYIHRLVAKAFCLTPDELNELSKLDVNHKDGNKKNNYYKNLEWYNRSQNQIHAFYTMDGRNIYGSDKYNSKLTINQIIEIKRLKSTGLSNAKVGKIFNVDRSVISRVNNDKSYIDNCRENLVKVGPILPYKHATYYQHHLVSAYDSLFYLKEEGLDNETILKISNYIQWHMQPFFMESDKARNKFINLVGQEFYDKLMILHEADVKAH